MPSIHKTSLWQITVPDAWTIYGSGENIMLFRPDGVGMLRVETSDTVGRYDLLAYARGHSPPARSLARHPAGAFVGLLDATSRTGRPGARGQGDEHQFTFRHHLRRARDVHCSLDVIQPRTMKSNQADTWPFDQPRNCATFTMRQVLDGSEPILLVSHDADDHGWQFIGTSDVSMPDAKLVCLEEIVRLDPTVLEVADLPPGWQAIRE